MKRILLILAIMSCTACTTQSKPIFVSQNDNVLRTELVTHRASYYSDVAILEEEEGTFIWLPEKISPFSIILTFNEKSKQAKNYFIYFDTGSAALSNSEQKKLIDIIPDLKKRDVYLVGYADPRGSENFNLKLSQKRAQAVAAFLHNLGIAVSRIDAKGESITGLLLEN